MLKKMDRIERTAVAVLRKYFRKGNMARCMRDVLPRSHLSQEERDAVAKIVHDVVRYQKYYSYLLRKNNLPYKPENYVALSTGRLKLQADISQDKLLEIRESLSNSLAHILQEKREFLRIINTEPETTLCTNFIKISREKLKSLLYSEGFDAQDYVPETALLASPGTRYSSAVREGFAHVQDASSQLVAKLTGKLGNIILDYCAGSGGKSLALASLYRNSLEIHAYDINTRKLESLKIRAKRHNATIKVHMSIPTNKYPVVLVDAPCSGVGAASRNPEAKYQENFENFKEMQLKILSESALHVEKGGMLVYVVCSFTPQETVEVVSEFLEKYKHFEVLSIEDIPCEYKKYLKKERYGVFVTAGDILYMAILRFMP